MNARRMAVVVPWHSGVQLTAFLNAWEVTAPLDWLLLQRDEHGHGCARTKNAGIHRAKALGFESVLILDDDCFPDAPGVTLDRMREMHCQALLPQPVEMFAGVTDPPSRGTPYFHRSMEMPVAASMGFWTEIGDYDACGQLVHGATHPMQFDQRPIFGKYFPLCGMNLAFSLSWLPWCEFIDVPRFDDIWQGWLWQKHAYRLGHCFNLAGPLVRHSRQSNVWANLRDESRWLEKNETLWRDIATSPATEYESLRALLPV